MTERQDERSTLAIKLRRGGTALAGLGLLGALLATGLGCDTVAVINFEERSYSTVHSSGFTAMPDACDTGAGQGNGDMKLRMVLTDNRQNPITLGDEIDEMTVESDSLRAENITLSDPVAFAEHDYGLGCSSNADCTGPNFECAEPEAEDGNSNFKVCHRNDPDFSITSDPEFVSDLDGHNIFGVLVENTGSLNGIPLDGGNREPDNATDWDKKRVDAIGGLETPFKNTAALANERQNRRSFFGLWTFGGVDNPESMSGEVDFVNTEGAVSSAIDRYEALEPTADEPANVYESLYNTLHNAYEIEKLAEYDMSNASAESAEKTLVLFVDGPDELGASSGNTVDQVIEKANKLDVRIFVVHLDPELELPDKLSDPPDYHTGQEEPCTDDTECKSYEECRRPTDSNGEELADDDYCMIARDSQTGRVGPIDEYARLACATGGGYNYVSSVEGLRENMSWLPYTMEGLWETEVRSSRLHRGEVPPNSPLFIHTNMRVSIGEKDDSYFFLHRGSNDPDNRSVIFSGE